MYRILNGPHETSACAHLFASVWVSPSFSLPPSLYLPRVRDESCRPQSIPDAQLLEIAQPIANKLHPTILETNRHSSRKQEGKKFSTRSPYKQSRPSRLPAISSDITSRLYVCLPLITNCKVEVFRASLKRQEMAYLSTRYIPIEHCMARRTFDARHIMLPNKNFRLVNDEKQRLVQA